MTKNEFKEQIAKYVQKYAPKYNVKVCSPVIAQAILESGWGTSELAVNANNFFGLKWSDKVTKNYYVKNATEQRKDGSYYVVNDTKWCKFSNMEEGVEGYFKFLFNRGLTRYDNLKNETNYENYVRKIREDGYATSLSYVDNILKVIKDNDLTKYDKENKGENKMGYTNSSLVNYTKISPNKTPNRNHAIDTITIHCVVGQVTVERLGDIFAPTSRQASSNYGVGKDGRIGMYVEEKDRSWCTSNAANDHRAITIEVASDTSDPYAVTPAAYEALIKLVADICKRNGIKKLVWSTNKNDRVNHLNGCNMTVHRDYANKSCPGEYLYSHHQDIANRVNAILGAKVETPSTPNKPNNTPSTPTTNNNVNIKVPFTVQVLVSDLNIRKEPKMGNNVVGVTGKNVFTIVEVKDGWGKLKSGAGWIYLENSSYVKINGTTSTTKTTNKTTTTYKKSKDVIAKEIIQGKYGNGTTRINNLKKLGYSDSEIKEIQKIVNKLCK